MTASLMNKMGLRVGVRDDERGNICPVADVWVYSRGPACALAFYVHARKELILEKSCKLLYLHFMRRGGT